MESRKPQSSLLLIRLVVVSLYLVTAGLAVGMLLNPPGLETLSTPETAMIGILLVQAGLVSFGILIISGLIVMGLAIYCVAKRQLRLLALIAFPALFAIYAMEQRAQDLIAHTPAFRANFESSLPELNTLADAVVAGTIPDGSRHAGNFEIVRSEKLPSGAILLVTKEILDDPKPPRLWGFVRASTLAMESRDAIRLGLGGSEWGWNSVLRLKGDWFVIYGHYEYIKRGWS